MINGDGDGKEDGEILGLYDKWYQGEKAPDRQK